MNLYGYYRITEFTTAAILILLYCGVLWHTFKGSKFTFVYTISTWLILTNIFLFVYVILEHTVSSDSFMIILIAELLIGLLFFSQNIAHLLLAFKYRRLAKEMPYNIEEVQLPETEKRCDRVLFKILFTLNTIIPALMTTFAVLGSYEC